MGVCPRCGKGNNEDGGKFCSECGCELPELPIQKEAPLKPPSIAKEKSVKSMESASEDEKNGGKVKASYFVSIGSAILTLIIRLSLQETFITWDNLLDNRKVVGLDADIKPFYTLIPIIATVIISLMIVSDKQTQSQKRNRAIILNIVFILLSVLFIWFDMPYSIVNF